MLVFEELQLPLKRSYLTSSKINIRKTELERNGGVDSPQKPYFIDKLIIYIWFTIRSLLDLDFPLKNCLVLSSRRNQSFVILVEFHASHVTRVASADYTLTVFGNTRVLEQSDFAEIITSCEQFHSPVVGSITSVNSIDVSTIHKRLPNTLNWPSQSNIPCGPFLISWHRGSCCYLCSSANIPKQQFIGSTDRMQPISISTKIKVFDIAAMFDRFALLLTHSNHKDRFCNRVIQ